MTPRWAVGALRALQREQPERPVPWHAIVKCGAVGVVVLAVFVGAPVAIGVMFLATIVGTIAVGGLARSTTARRWKQRRGQLEELARASTLRDALHAELDPGDLRELARLEAIVEVVRGWLRIDPSGADTELVGRLDTLLHAFVRTAIALRKTERSLGLSGCGVLEAVPGSLVANPPTASPGPASPMGPPVHHGARTRQLLGLRTVARSRCAAVAEVLRAELLDMGHAVRLIYEEALADRALSTELSTALEETVDEATLAREARQELGSSCRERGHRLEMESFVGAGRK